MPPSALTLDAIVCFSHLRWDFVYQRPQHLLSCFARHQPVLYVEEPVATDGEPPIDLRDTPDGVRVAVPRLPADDLFGAKRCDELPRYLGRWDVAMMPFALNAATRFISPTKTPEYLAGGCPVVSTPIADVVASYGDCGLVHVGAGAQGFIDAVEAARAGPAARSPAFCARADALLHDRSWNRSVAEMHVLIKQCMAAPALTAAAA